MTELSKEEKSAYWDSLKKEGLWVTLRKDSTATPEQQATAKENINKAQKALGLDLTDWNKPKPGYTGKGGNETLGKVNWNLIESVNEVEVNRYGSVVATACHIVSVRHPEMDINSNVYGTIVSSVVGHLIALRS